MSRYALQPGMAWIILSMILGGSVAAAETQTLTGRYWGQWQALGSGYLARRKVPANADLPVAQRRLPTTQARLPAGKAGNRLKSESNTILVPGSGDNRKVRKALWLGTKEAGLYAVSVADLASQMGTSEDSIRSKAGNGNLSLLNAGRPVSWYFDAGTDRLLFAAVAYDTFYTDRNAYYLAQTAADARPMDPAPVPGGQLTPDLVPSPRAFPETLKFEQEPDYFFATWSVAAEPDADYWFWDYLYAGTKDVIEVPLEIPNPEVSGMAQLRVTLRGWTDLLPGDEHTVYAELNGTQVGTAVTWDGFEEMLLVADFPQELLAADGNNILRLYNRYAPGTTPGQWLDQIEVDYHRLPVADNGVLWLHEVPAGRQQVSGFSSADVLVIEDPAGEALLHAHAQVVEDGAGGWLVEFDADGTTDFLVAQSDATLSPMITEAPRLAPKQRQNFVDYLIIAPRVFSGTAEALADYRAGQFANVSIAWLDEIYAEYSHGRVDPWAITRYMDEVRGWRLPPSHVVLIGKGSLDQKDRMGYGDGFLPVLMTSTPWALAASDERLLVGEDVADFAIGRLPITNDAEGMAYVDKLIRHETQVSGHAYRAVLVADDPDDAGDFHANSDLLDSRLRDSLGFDETLKLYHPDTGVRTSLTDSATWEAGYISYDGHGSTAQIGNNGEKFLQSADAVVLSNSNYPIFTALTCAAGDDTYPGTRSLAGALVLNPVGGAIASLAPTGLSLDADAQILGNAFVDALYVGGHTIGAAIQSAKVQTNGSISAFMPRMYSVVGDPSLTGR